MAPTSSQDGDLMSSVDSLSQAVKSAMSLIHHIKDVVYVCDHESCQAKFPTLTRLKKHKLFHNDIKPFMCENEGCYSSFKTNSHLKRHEKMVHQSSPAQHKKPKKTHICRHCSKTCKNKTSLKVHEAVHTGDKPFKCDICNMAFALQGRLKSHQKTHMGYPCPFDGCDFVADKWTHLRKHKVVHKLPCPKCCHSFSSEQSLDTHVKSCHPTDKPFVCPNCSSTYTKKSNLMAHIRASHEKVFFQCTIEGCDRKFAHKKSLKHHIKTFHETNHPKPPNKSPKICRRKVAFAEVISGFDAGQMVRIEILEEDKRYRQDQIIVNDR